MFPIFPVDYPFIRKGHSFIMDLNGQARTKATKKPITKPLGQLFGRLCAGVILAGLLPASSGFEALAQQPAKTVAKPVVRPLTANVPPKTSSTTQANPQSSSPTSLTDPQQLLAAGQAAQDQGRFEEAIRTYNRVIALSANQSRTAAIANLRIGNAYMAQGKFGNAQVAFERAVTLNPTDAEAYNNLGEALGELKQYPRALEAFNKAISLDVKTHAAKLRPRVCPSLETLFKQNFSSAGDIIM